MKTTKPISTISFNSEEFLKSTLDRLIENQILQFYAFIKHLPEEDEKKSHFHVYMIPNKEIDLMSFGDFFKELDLNNTIPRGIKLIQKSKFDDWYLYGKHDKVYLASKLQSRKYHYKDEDFITSDFESFKELTLTIDNKSIRTERFIELALSGYQFIEIVRMGVVPMPQFNQYQKLYNELIGDYNTTIRKDGSSPTNDEEDEKSTHYEEVSEDEDLPF